MNDKELIQHTETNALLFRKLKEVLKSVYGDDKDILDMHMEALINTYYPTG